ncbi:MAG: glutamine synthetase family protein [Bacteroidales bacterium]|nr:glutamine synthetase family protein [Bacteroidales bacterium]MDZ4205387.1 glutamine synthetase family protein [Bacteroidales bacterium]
MNSYIELNPNPLVQYLNKPALDFTKADLIKYIGAQNIQMINYRYVGADGRLKALNFAINNRKHLETILSQGERVDGSSLFSHIEVGSSDLYVMPRYRTAFLNPFNEIPALDILCSYYTKDGEPMRGSPEQVVRKAHQMLKARTGFEFHVMGELEYYVISPVEDLFKATDQRGYHESTPFIKWEQFRTEAMMAIAQSGGIMKYGHSEVGNFVIDDLEYEQNEIEFHPVAAEDAADQLVIAKWLLRTMAYKYGVTITFAPKITAGKAGSGLHFHTKLVKEGKNMMLENGKLSDHARKAIAGYLDLAPSLTAFGNTNPTSYFRLVPNQEAPTNICWGDRNRSVLVRVPLGWTGKHNMISDANPIELNHNVDLSDVQTVEYRCPDGSADVYYTIAGLAVAARHGLEMPDALEYAENTYVDTNIFSEENKGKMSRLKLLPISCWESAEKLQEQKEYYMKHDVFPENLLDGTIKRLKSYNDKNLRQSIQGDEKQVLKLVEEYFHCG